MGHVVLLGDSIFDNGSYVSGGSPVIEQLRSRLPREWRATLLARDGAVTTGVLQQLQRLPEDATHLVMSAGGNDALGCTPIIHSPTPRSADLLVELAAMQTEFRSRYGEVIDALRKTRLPIVACTIYDAVPGLSPIERTALSLFNDVILRELIAAHIPALDLRFVCHEGRDYSSVSPIEPSEIGGSKIARTIQHIVLGYDFSRVETTVYR